MAERDQRRNLEDDESLRGESDEKVRGVAPDEDIDEIDDEFEDEDEDRRAAVLTRRVAAAVERMLVPAARRVIDAWLHTAATPPRGRRAWSVRRPSHRSPTLPEPRRRRADREVARIDRAVHFLPGQRRRHAGVVARARAVGGRQRLAEDVLQEVDVDRAARPPLHRALDRRHLRVPRRDEGRDDLAEQHARLVRACPAAAERRCAGRSTPEVFGKPRHAERRAARRGPSARRRAPCRTSRRRSDRDRSRSGPRRAATARARTTGPARSPRSASCRAASSAIRR